MWGIVEQVVKEMKAHPITLSLVLICGAFMIVGYTSFASASEVELLKTSLASQSKINTCRWLSDKISTLETDIYILERDEADAKWINEKKIDLSKLKVRYQQTTCSTTGY